jgi:HK97 family phage major capsid protein
MPPTMEDVGRKLDAIATENKTFIETNQQKQAEHSARLLAIEQRISSQMGGGPGDGFSDGVDLGGKIVCSEGFKSLQMGARASGQIQVGQFHKTNVINATGQNQPLVPDFRVTTISSPAPQRLTIRDLMPSFPCPSNMVQFPKETGFTNAAAMQAGEGVAKGESAMTFALSNAPVQTLAHWIPISKQLLDDATALQAYINQRMLYFLKIKEEDQLLNGSGTGNNILGLIAQSTPYDTAFSTPASDTYIDTVARAIEQVQLTNFDPDAIVMNPKDLWQIQLIKTVGGGADGRYMYSDPYQPIRPRLWGLPIVSTASIAQGQFLVGAFQIAAAIWDRQDATIEISREHSDFFVKNLCALLAEERLALTVFRSEAIIFAGFPYGS